MFPLFSLARGWYSVGWANDRSPKNDGYYLNLEPHPPSGGPGDEDDRACFGYFVTALLPICSACGTRSRLVIRGGFHCFHFAPDERPRFVALAGVLRTEEVNAQ